MSRRVAVGVALLATPASFVGVASAGVDADSTATTTLGSAVWSVVPTQSSSTPPPPGPLVLTATSTTPQYFEAVNTGTVSLTGMSYVVTLTAVGGGSPSVTLTACSVGWAGGTCAGTSVSIGTWTSKTNPPAGQVASGTTVVTTAVPATPSSVSYVQATPSGVPRTGVTIGVDTSVTSGPGGDLPAGTTTNS